MTQHILSKDKKRIWELDALRGIFIIGMIIIHIIFDLENFSQIKLPQIPLLVFFNKYGFSGFLLISGICITFSKNTIKRGLIVFIFALLLFLTTYIMYYLGIIKSCYIITFGILHLISISMLTYPLYKKLPLYISTIIGICVIFLGLYFQGFRVPYPYLFAFGLRTSSYCAGDYFPIFPYMGVFILGSVIGRLFYKDKKSFFPSIEKYFSFLSFIGRNSMIIYIIHQPIIYVFLLFVLK